MTSAVSSANLATGSNSADGPAALAELTKQVQKLRQKLARANPVDTSEPANSQNAMISREIVSVQAQIERLVLEAQLTRLQPASSAAATSKAATPKDSKATGGQNGGIAATPKQSAAAAAAHYKLVDPKIKHLDLQA